MAVASASEHRFKAILDASPVPMALNDASQRITLLNAAFVKTFGYTREEIPTLTEWWPKAYPDGAYRQWVSETWQRELERARTTGTEFAPIEVGVCCADGATKTVLASATSLSASFEDTHLVVLYDISERKRAEDALREQDDRYRTILRTATDGFWVVDATGRIREVNDAYARMSGYTERELVDMHISDLDAEESNAAAVAHAGRIMAAGADFFEARHRRKDGTLWHVEVTARKLPGDDRHVAAFLRDISPRRRLEAERTRLEAELHQAQKMESIGRLAGGIAHDFNNMLAVIIGNAEIALDGLDAQGRLHSSLSEIRLAAQRSAELTRQLLTFARRQTVQPRVLDLNAAIGGGLKMLARLIGEDIRLDWRPSPGLWSVRMDPSQVDQILANLCVNSRDAIQGVGTIAIATRNVSICDGVEATSFGQAPGDYVRLTVSDDGCGMPGPVLERVFEPFFTTKALGAGTGLGLATVYGAVRQNHGSIGVNSSPGVGTTFTIDVPRHLGPVDAVDSGARTSAMARGDETILLVEDESALLAMARLGLERCGYRVLVASTPGDAVRVTAEHRGRIALLLTDVVMPGMDGLELAARLTSIRPDMKRLFMSGYTADVMAGHGVVGEGEHFLQKPFTLQQLASRVRDVLDRD